MQKITISKKLSIQFKISRNQAENLIKNKKVTLNGNIETRPFISVTDKDIFEIEKLKSLEEDELEKLDDLDTEIKKIKDKFQ